MHDAAETVVLVGSGTNQNQRTEGEVDRGVLKEIGIRLTQESIQIVTGITKRVSIRERGQRIGLIVQIILPKNQRVKRKNLKGLYDYNFFMYFYLLPIL